MRLLHSLRQRPYSMMRRTDGRTRGRRTGRRIKVDEEDWLLALARERATDAECAAGIYAWPRHDGPRRQRKKRHTQRRDGRRDKQHG